MKYSLTQAGHVVQLVSAVMVVMGAKPFSEEEASALIVVIGLIAQGFGWLIAWYGRYRQGDVTIAGVMK